MKTHLLVLSLCVRTGFCLGFVAVDWTGREPHPAVVNPVARPADDPNTLSLRGTWEFVPCELSTYRCASVMTLASGWKWSEKAKVRKVEVPSCYASCGAIETVATSQPWVCAWDCDPQVIRGFHVGEGWYRKTVTIPEAWKGKRIWLKTGWANSTGCFWIDGKPVTMETTYCATWKYDVTDLVTPGKSCLVVAETINATPSHRGCFNIVHRWGGLIREPEFEATPTACWVDDAWVRGNFDADAVEVHVEVGSSAAGGRSLRVTVEGEPAVGVTAALPADKLTTNCVLRLPLKSFRLWSPEHPNLYTARIELVESGAVVQTRFERFGLRKFERRGKDLFLNGKPFFARGAGWHDLQPIEGAAPADRGYWLERAKRVRAAGFNFIRLHTTCRPPEFFEACDETGLMVEAELPYYNDVPSDGQRFDPREDARELYLNYRRYPSFTIYSGGNEGTFGPHLAKKLYDEIRRRDPDRLVMAQDSALSRKEVMAVSSDFTAGEMTVWPRGVNRSEQPMICHEYLNLSVKLDARLEDRFTGVWQAPITRKRRAEFLAKSGLSGEIGDLLQEAQHALQATWRKYGLESARLDPECDGYFFWSLQDVCVPNKGTPAAQALFDPFWGDKKGGETVEQVAIYNSPSCVLLRDGNDPELWEHDMRKNWVAWKSLFADSIATNRVRKAGELLKARFYLAHFGESPVEKGVLTWRLLGSTGEVLVQGRREIGLEAIGGPRLIDSTEIVVPENLQRAMKARLEATVRGVTGERKFVQSNSWDYWLFPKRTEVRGDRIACADQFRAALSPRYADLRPERDWEGASTVIAPYGSELEKKALAAGKSVVSLAGQEGEPNIFLGWWWMGSQMGSVVLDHPMLRNFPHQGVFSPLFFRIAREGLKLPVEGFSQGDFAMVGEGAEACYLYLAERQLPNGARHCLIAGLDVLSDTPEGTAILDSAVCRQGKERR